MRTYEHATILSSNQNYIPNEYCIGNGARATNL